MKTVSQLQVELDKIKKQLDKLHKKEADMGLHGNGTMRKAKLQVNIEYYCKEKFRVEGELEEARLKLQFTL